MHVVVIAGRARVIHEGSTVADEGNDGAFRVGGESSTGGEAGSGIVLGDVLHGTDGAAWSICRQLHQGTKWTVNGRPIGFPKH